jgi:hypothetical protein
MDSKAKWPSQRARAPRSPRSGVRITWRRETPARVRWMLWILFIGLQIADVVTTNRALAIPGNWEANPIMQFSQTHLGAAWWLPKVGAVGFAAVAMPQTFRPWPILLVVWYYVIVVSGNLVSL